MATNLTLSATKAQELVKRADSAMAKLNKVRGKTEEKVGEVFKMVETVGASLAVGYARVKWGEVTVGPEIPIEAIVGGALTMAAFLDLPGKYSEHIHNVGNGVLGGWATLEAVKLGGGIVLSEEEYTRLMAAAPAPEKKLEAPAPAAEEPVAARQVRALPNGQRTRTARETFAHDEQSQTVEASKGAPTS